MGRSGAPCPFLLDRCWAIATALLLLAELAMVLFAGAEARRQTARGRQIACDREGPPIW